MIRLATVFSGIGAPEQALRQLKEDVEIIFACDNGERELDLSYEEILERTKDMSSEERVEFVNELYKNTNKENNYNKPKNHEDFYKLLKKNSENEKKKLKKKKTKKK